MIKCLFKIFCFFLISLIFISTGWCSDNIQKARGVFDMGMFAFEDSDYHNAEKYFKRALKLDKDNAYYMHYLAKTYAEKEQYRLAKKYLLTAKNINPALLNLDYDMALLYFKMKEYQRAGDMFETIIAEDPLNDLVREHYYAGICFYMQKSYQKALTYFIKTADLNESIKESAQLYESICYFHIQEINKSIQLLKNLVNTSDSPTIKTRATRYLKTFEKIAKNQKPYHLFSKMSFIYDDNVSVISSYMDVENVDDFLFQGYFSGKYHLIHSHLYQAGAGYTQYISIHQDKSEYDMIGSTLNVYVKYRMNPLTASMAYMPSYYWLDNERYIRNQTIKSDMAWKVISQLMVRFSYAYSMNQHYQENERSGHSHKLHFLSQYQFSDKGRTILWDTMFEDNHANGYEYQHERTQTKLKYSFLIQSPIDLIIDLSGKYQKRNYLFADSAFHQKRNDNTFSFEMASTRKINDNIWGKLEYQYTRNNSNINYYDYRKNMIYCSLIIKY